MSGSHVPLLSVVVPVYRVEEYLARCLDSILAEAGGKVEVVAVDDHSPDRSGAILDDYQRRDARVRVIHLAANVGLGRARNAGQEQARGEYLWFVDSDDWLPAGAMPAVLARLVETRPDVLVLDHVEVREDGAALATLSGAVLREITKPVRVAELPELLRMELATSACTKVIRRGLVDGLELRFPPGWYEDCAYTFPLLLAAEQIDALDRVCYYYRRRPSGAITRSVSARHFDVFDQYERMWEWVDAAGPEHDALRPELFRLMIDHMLVVAGNDTRLPKNRRRDFFRRVVEEYQRHRPAGGYRLPRGWAGIRHRLVRRNAYLPYALMRQGRRLARRSRLVRVGTVAVPEDGYRPGLSQEIPGGAT